MFMVTAVVTPPSRMDPYPKLGSNVVTEAAAHAPKQYEKFKVSLSGQSRSGLPEVPKMA